MSEFIREVKETNFDAKVTISNKQIYLYLPLEFAEKYYTIKVEDNLITLTPVQKGRANGYKAGTTVNTKHAYLSIPAKFSGVIEDYKTKCTETVGTSDLKGILTIVIPDNMERGTRRRRLYTDNKLDTLGFLLSDINVLIKELGAIPTIEENKVIVSIQVTGDE